MIKIFLLFFMGAVAGSFANCLIWRLPREESIVWPPSHCPKCQKKLGVLDLIPILSYLFLNGRCRYCREKIGIKYLAVEILLGFLFVLSGLVFHRPLEVLFFSVLSVLFVIMTFIDLEHQVLPDSLTFLAAALALLYHVMSRSLPLENIILSGLGAGLGFLIISYVSGLIWKQDTLGGGDVKLALAFGFIFGWPNVLLALFLSFFVGAIIGIYLMLILKKSKKDYMPFGPSMIMAAYITIFWAPQLWNLYFRFLVR